LLLNWLLPKLGVALLALLLELLLDKLLRLEAWLLDKLLRLVAGLLAVVLLLLEVVVLVLELLEVLPQRASAPRRPASLRVSFLLLAIATIVVLPSLMGITLLRAVCFICWRFYVYVHP
jgi:hypothetical protein